MFLSYALMAYLISFSTLVLRMFINSKIATILVIIFALLGMGLNTHEIAIRFVAMGGFQSATIFDFSTLLSIAFVLVFLILYYKYKRVVMGLFILPFSIIFSLLSMFTPIVYPSHIVFSVWRYVHLPFVIIGTVLFIVSFISALMYMLLEVDLKKKRFGMFYKLFPPLDSLNKINDHTMRWGFYFFTLGSVLGFFWLMQLITFSDELFMNALLIFASNIFTFKIIFSIITWIYFAIVIAIKAKYGLPSRKLAWFTVVGFFSVIITYIGVGVFLIW